MNRTIQRRVPATGRHRREERGRTDPVQPTTAQNEPVVTPEPPVVSGHRAVRTQILVGGLSGISAVMLGLVLSGFPMAANAGVFFEPSAGELMPTLPLLMLVLLQLMALLGTVVPAVRIGRMMRWAAIDPGAAPVQPWVARAGAAALWVLVVASLVTMPLGWMLSS